jgi:hypothetical protein
VFPTAPVVVKRTKLAAVPKLGACAKLRVEKDKKVTQVTILSNIVFIKIGLSREIIFTG